MVAIIQGTEISSTTTATSPERPGTLRSLLASWKRESRQRSKGRKHHALIKMNRVIFIATIIMVWLDDRKSKIGGGTSYA